jgi:hypothetical protein
LLGLYGVWHCHDEAIPLLPVGLDAFCELYFEASRELHSIVTCYLLTCRIILWVEDFVF